MIQIINSTNTKKNTRITRVQNRLRFHSLKGNAIKTTKYIYFKEIGGKNQFHICLNLKNLLNVKIRYSPRFAPVTRKIDN